MPNTFGNVSVGWMPAFDAGVVSIIVRSSLIASAPDDGEVGAGAAGLQPAPNNEAMNPRMAITRMGDPFGRTVELSRPRKRAAPAVAGRLERLVGHDGCEV